MSRAARARVTYRPGTSLLHKLHPLVKSAWLVSLTVFVFVVDSAWIVTGLVGVLWATFVAAGLGLSGVRGARLFATTALALGLVQILFVDEGQVLIELGPVMVTTGGVAAGVYVAGRFLAVVLISYLFVLTTEPNDLAYALMQAGVPYRYGFALVTALRLVPVFEEEGQIVYNAQLARGVEYDVRSPRRFVVLARQFFLPLLVSALGKVDSLAVSMEGRCFAKYPERTFLREVRMTARDWVALAGLVGLGIGYWGLASW
ncbi:MAG: energy-coupling factor transporter transmembrane protein EcfT [Anaerolineae bacterium]|nr:energy-coupling factor transporter transmembrane protein EcfT [Anaerolineae bacterium]